MAGLSIPQDRRIEKSVPVDKGRFTRINIYPHEPEDMTVARKDT
jgi:hypothetical protein